MAYFIGAHLYNRHLENIVAGNRLDTEASAGFEVETGRVQQTLQNIFGETEAGTLSNLWSSAKFKNSTNIILNDPSRARATPRGGGGPFVKDGYFYDAEARILYINNKTEDAGIGARTHWLQPDATLVRLAFATIGSDGRTTLFVHQNLARDPSDLSLQLMLKNMYGGIATYRIFGGALGT